MLRHLHLLTLGLCLSGAFLLAQEEAPAPVPAEVSAPAEESLTPPDPAPSSQEEVPVLREQTIYVPHEKLEEVWDELAYILRSGAVFSKILKYCS